MAAMEQAKAIGRATARSGIYLDDVVREIRNRHKESVAAERAKPAKQKRRAKPGRALAIVNNSVASLDLLAIKQTLARFRGNVSQTAEALKVPTAELRHLTRVHPELIKLSLELQEQRIDKIEANIDDALWSEDVGRRDRMTAFAAIHAPRVSQRQWGLSPAQAEAAEHKAAMASRGPVRVEWAGPGDSAIEDAMATVHKPRDERLIGRAAPVVINGKVQEAAAPGGQANGHEAAPARIMTEADFDGLD
jgi:hypothetical protein